MTRSLRRSSGFNRLTTTFGALFESGRPRLCWTIAFDTVQSARSGIPGLLVSTPLNSTSIFGTV